jgi:hypothetical protein
VDTKGGFDDTRGSGIARAVAQGVERRGHVIEVVDDDMDDALFALQFAGAAHHVAPRALPDQHDIGDRELPVDRQMGEPGAGREALAGELRTHLGERVAASR